MSAVHIEERVCTSGLHAGHNPCGCAENVCGQCGQPWPCREVLVDALREIGGIITGWERHAMTLVGEDPLLISPTRLHDAQRDEGHAREIRRALQKVRVLR